MNTKTFEAIDKLKEVELELHRLKNALEMANKSLDAQRTWVGLTDGEVDKMILLMGFPPDWITENAIVKNIVRNLEAKLKEKNT
jgi:hypothetical protein